MAEKSLAWTDDQKDQLVPWIILGVLTAALVYVYWNTLSVTAQVYWNNPKYSHGYLVPLFTLALIWLRYEPFGPVTSSARWAGVALLSAGLGIRLLATYFPNITPEMYSFVPCVGGLFLLVGGWPTLKWAGPAIAFLIFMFPLPGPLDRGLLMPLQKFATNASTYCLQTLGVPTYCEGNVIYIGEVKPLSVVEACSGLRMLTIFIALAVAITLVTNRPIWERIVIILSAIPIALAVNIIRITVTGLLYLTVSEEIASKVFHDLAGWVMMPMALGLLYVELQVLSHIVIDDGMSGPSSIGLGPRPERQTVSASSG